MKFHLLHVSYLRTNRCTITRCILILEEQPSSSQSNEIKDPTKQTIENSRETPAQNKIEERINELNSQISALVKLRDTGLAVVDKDKITKLKKELKEKELLLQRYVIELLLVWVSKILKCRFEGKFENYKKRVY